MRDRYSEGGRGSLFFPGSPPSAPAVPGRPVPWAGRLGRRVFGACPVLFASGVCYVSFFCWFRSSCWFRCFSCCGSCRCCSRCWLRSLRPCLSRCWVCCCACLGLPSCRLWCGVWVVWPRCSCFRWLLRCGGWSLVPLSCVWSWWCWFSCLPWSSRFSSFRPCLWCCRLVGGCSGSWWPCVFWFLLWSGCCCCLTSVPSSRAFGSFVKGLRSVVSLVVVNWPLCRGSCYVEFTF